MQQFRELQVERNSSRCYNLQKNKDNRIRRKPLTDKNIGDNASLSNSKTYLCSENDDQSYSSSSTLSTFADEEEEIETPRNAIDYTVRNRSGEKCVCFNLKIQQSHDHRGDFCVNQKSLDKNESEKINGFSSDDTLENKYTELINKTPRSYRSHPNYATKKTNERQTHEKDLKQILKTLKKLFKSTADDSKYSKELEKIYEIVKTLQQEQGKFQNLIEDQQNQLTNFQSKYMQAENIIQNQKYEIKQLHFTNAKLENELNTNIDALKEKLQAKINEVSDLPRAVKAEKTKADKLSRQNNDLIVKLQQVKQELDLTRAKFVEAVQKRATILAKLKTGEKDIKIFRNQNHILRTEKRTLIEELKKLKGFNDDLTTRSNRNMTRQKERGVTQQRLLQKRILDLELELTQSRNSTSDLIEERDKHIEELHRQLNTLVHNFEVSQKHIRVLRKQIISMSGNSAMQQITK